MQGEENDGTHWTCMQLNIRAIKSDPYSLTLMAPLTKKKFVDTGKNYLIPKKMCSL